MVADDKFLEYPGAALREAREQAGISLQQIAERTRIPSNRLEALERDDYDAVGGRAYVIGYARAYARIIGVPPQGYVGAFEHAFRRADPLYNNPEAARAEALRMERNRQKSMLPAVAGVVAIILLLTWFLSSQQQPASLPEVVDSSPPAEDAPVTIAQPLPASDDTPKAELAEPIEPAVSISAAPPAPAGAPLREPVSAPVSVVQAAPALETADPAEELTVSTAVDSEPPGTPATLGLSFTEECWVEVIDATGKTVVARVAQSGDNLQISGRAPFEVTLGNANAASVTLNGESVPAKPKRGRRVLHLRVGE